MTNVHRPTQLTIDVAVLKHFFDDPRTRSAIATLASANPLVLFAGAGLSASMRLPPWTVLLERLLEDVALGRNVPPEEVNTFVETLLATTQPDVLGSIVRTRLRGEESFNSSLHKQIYAEAGPVAGGFSAFIRAFCDLILVRHRKGLQTIVLTTNYDDLIESAMDSDPALSRVRAALSVRVKPVSQLFLPASRPGTLPIYHLHGYLPREGARPKGQKIVLSTADFGEDWTRHWSHSLFAEHWNSQWFFVGMSFSDMHINFYLTQRLRECLEGAPRPIGIFSRQGRPWRDLPEATRAALTEVELLRLNELALNALATKYYFQDAQFLRELVLLMTHGDVGVKPYVERRKLWNTCFHRGPTSTTDRRDRLVQRCHQTLVGIRSDLEEFLSDTSERFKVELWCRWEDGNELVQLASSEYIARELSRAPRFALSQETARIAAVESFTQGRLYTTPVDYETDGSRWQCFSGVPVILSAPPWYELPVGSLVLGSTRTRKSSTLQTHRLDIEAKLGDWLASCVKLLQPLRSQKPPAKGV